jgi:uncharacterized protein (DUF302 family)
MTRSTFFNPFSLLTLAAGVTSLSPAFAQPVAMPVAVQAVTHAEGVLRVRSANSFDETVVRLKSDVQAKGIRLFDQIDHAALGAQADLKTGRSTLVLFGNPPLGVQFLQASPYAGLDWPVRMLVVEEADGSVWVAWTDFAVIAKRYAIRDRDAQLKMASEVAASIAAAAAGN